MDIDVSTQLGLVTRTVEEVERGGRPAQVVVAARTYPTSVEDLWEAISSPERIPRWFLPVSGDLRLGGRYDLDGSASGEVLVCEPPHRLEVTWEVGGDVSWVAVELSEHADGARLELRHASHPEADFHETYGPGATGAGWEGALLGLGLHVAGGGIVVDRDALAAWEATDDGRAFLTGASRAWGDADAVAGADPATAQARAERTASFYTGTEGADG